MSVPDQMRRERTRAIVIASFELVLGALMIIIGWQLYSASDTLRLVLYEIQQSPYPPPQWVFDIFNAALSGALLAGFFAFIHGIKRIVDNVLNAWVRSALPEE